MAYPVSLRDIEQIVGTNPVPVLVSVAGIPQEHCDGSHHPCPKCGGTDRFRVIDLRTGTCYCNNCFTSGNGNFINAVMHFRGVSFPNALRLIADHLGLLSGEAPKVPPLPSSRKAKSPAASITRVIHPVLDASGSCVAMRVNCTLERKSWFMTFPWNGFTYAPDPASLSPSSHVKKHTIYEYTDSEGHPHHLVYRMDLKQGRKIPMQFHWDGSAYVSGKGDLEPIPFNAPALVKADRVFFVEGEKCAVALSWYFSRNPPEGSRPAVTCINCGCGAFHDSYVEWFRGKELFIYPDHDEPGMRLAWEVYEKVHDVVTALHIYRWPSERPPKWDIADEVMEDFKSSFS